jgi:hypothetical protein
MESTVHALVVTSMVALLCAALRSYLNTVLHRNLSAHTSASAVTTTGSDRSFAISSAERPATPVKAGEHCCDGNDGHDFQQMLDPFSLKD